MKANAAVAALPAARASEVPALEFAAPRLNAMPELGAGIVNSKVSGLTIPPKAAHEFSAFPYRSEPLGNDERPVPP